MAGFLDAGPLQQVAINLFYGWGYNFYRQENQFRTDDQLVRSKADGLLAAAAASLAAAEDGYRRSHLPPPSRAHPTPAPEAVAGAVTLERTVQEIRGLQGRLAQLPTPENDRMTQRFRREAPTLAALVACDQQLVGQAELLRSTVQSADGDGLLAQLNVLHEGIAAIRATLQARSDLLMG